MSSIGFKSRRARRSVIYKEGSNELLGVSLHFCTCDKAILIKIVRGIDITKTQEYDTSDFFFNSELWWQIKRCNCVKGKLCDPTKHCP